MFTKTMLPFPTTPSLQEIGKHCTPIVPFLCWDRTAMGGEEKLIDNNGRLNLNSYCKTQEASLSTIRSFSAYMLDLHPLTYHRQQGPRVESKHDIELVSTNAHMSFLLGAVKW